MSLVKAEPRSSSVRQIAMLMGVRTKKLRIYDIGINSLDSEFSLPATVTEIEKPELLVLDNPHYHEVIERHSYLQGVRMDDTDQKSQLPLHIILGANDFAKIRTGERLCVGCHGDPVAEYTSFGWTLMSPGINSGCLKPISHLILPLILTGFVHWTSWDFQTRLLGTKEMFTLSSKSNSQDRPPLEG